MSTSVKPLFLIRRMSKEEIIGYVREMEAAQYGSLLLVLFHLVFFISVKVFHFGNNSVAYSGLWFFSAIVLLVFGQKSILKTILFFILAAGAGVAFEPIRNLYQNEVGIRHIELPIHFSYKGVSFVLVLFFLCVEYGAGMLVNAGFNNRNILIRSILGGIVVASLQLWVESVGCLSGFWKWETDPIPLNHFLFYGLFSIPIQLIFFSIFKNEVFKNGVVLLCLQFLLFGFINY